MKRADELGKIGNFEVKSMPYNGLSRIERWSIIIFIRSSFDKANINWKKIGTLIAIYRENILVQLNLQKGFQQLQAEAIKGILKNHIVMKPSLDIASIAMVTVAMATVTKFLAQ